METIHKHDVFAQRGGPLGEIRGELADGQPRGGTPRSRPGSQPGSAS